MPPPPNDVDLSDSASEVDSDSSAGYEDAPDADIGEDTPAKCLFCAANTFPGAREVFLHCAAEHGFEWKTAAKGLDFYGRIKLVNYIRTLTAQGKTYDPADRGFEDEKFLQPVLEEDPVLFSLEDGEEEEGEESPEVKIRELEEKLRDLALQFQQYKEAVSESFVKKMDEKTPALAEKKEETPRDDDSHYFNSYAGNGEWWFLFFFEEGKGLG
jgi:protein arginine N-methyltransferase 3